VTSTTDTTTTIPTTTTPTSSTTSTSVIQVEPYSSYEATGPDGPVVMLADELGSETVDLGAIDLHLTPVAIDGVPAVLNPFLRATCYAHPGGVVDQCVDVQHAFGTTPLRIGMPVDVCAPELSLVPQTDAFKCYAATGPVLDVDVGAVDAFQSQVVTIGAPELFCTPVAIDGSPLVNPIRYLVCYATTPPGVAGVQIEVENTLHVDPIQVNVGSSTGVCIPAVRQVPSTCDLCGNGTIDTGEDCDDGGFVAGDGCSPVCRYERDCTCDGIVIPPPDDARCAIVADCASACSPCSLAAGVCGCQ
jgi:cysteine-rich repeat protein